MSETPEQEQLIHVLVMAQPLVAWMVRHGVGYAAFAAALKPLFLEAAQSELSGDARRVTDSALSLRAGLHRKDVRQLRGAAAESRQALAAQGQRWSKPSAASQVFTRWITSDLPHQLPFDGADPSFATLVQSVSRDMHHRAVLEELQRLELVSLTDGVVALQQQRFVPSPDQQQRRNLFAAAIADHLHAGSDNLSSESPPHLDQSLFANGLSAESVAQLTEQARLQWQQVLQQLVSVAEPLIQQDRDIENPHRFRLGMFTYSTPEAASTPPLAPEEDQERSR